MKKITSLILAIVMIFACFAALTSCKESACTYLETRDTNGRNIRYAEIKVEGYKKIVVLLDATTAPQTVANFISLANAGFYDGLTFHRIIDGFMIQGGDPDATGSGGSKEEIFGEFDSNGHTNDIKHLRGVISMARANDPNSASSQFFICHADASHLDGNYAAFGYVVDGLNVIDDIVSDTMEKCEEYYGTYYESWLYYGNGSLTSSYGPIKELQPKIEYIKVLDAWK